MLILNKNSFFVKMKLFVNLTNFPSLDFFLSVIFEISVLDLVRKKFNLKIKKKKKDSQNFDLKKR